jgi:hypothetical protein
MRPAIVTAILLSLALGAAVGLLLLTDAVTEPPMPFPPLAGIGGR